METESPIRVLLVCARGAVRWALASALAEPEFEVLFAEDGEQGLHRMRREQFDAVLCESDLQRIPVERLIEQKKGLSGQTTLIVLTEGLKSQECASLIHMGADDLLEIDTPAERIKERLIELLESRPSLSEWPPSSESKEPLERILGGSLAIQKVKDTLHRLAQVRSAVLFTGETGTGKTLAAEVLHGLSPRAGKPFIRVDCPALSRTLIESELFGHERGAFTDAKISHPGAFERASGGTVLLEEIGDLPAPTQSNILRLLETGEAKRIGSSQTFRPNVRVLVATAESLESLATRGGIRSNLLYRLQGVRVHLPPLRERKEDVPQLIQGLLPEVCRNSGLRLPSITYRAVKRLSEFDWPGNVRQLIHTLEGMAATSTNGKIDISDIPLQLRGTPGAERSIQIPSGSSLADAEKQLIRSALEAAGGNKNQAAKALGIGLRTLYRKIELYGIS